jgi:hypothetical protein
MQQTVPFAVPLIPEAIRLLGLQNALNPGNFDSHWRIQTLMGFGVYPSL